MKINNATNEPFFTQGCAFAAISGNLLAAQMPRTNGTPMISAICATISSAFRFTDCNKASVSGRRLPQNARLSGMRKIARTFDTAVMDTESATSPPAR